MRAGNGNERRNVVYFEPDVCNSPLFLNSTG